MLHTGVIDAMNEVMSDDTSHWAKVHEVGERVVVEGELQETGGDQQLIPGVVVGHERVIGPVYPLLLFVHVVLQSLVPGLLYVVVHTEQVSKVIILVYL